MITRFMSYQNVLHVPNIIYGNFIDIFVFSSFFSCFVNLYSSDSDPTILFLNITYCEYYLLKIKLNRIGNGLIVKIQEVFILLLGCCFFILSSCTTIINQHNTLYGFTNSTFLILQALGKNSC